MNFRKCICLLLALLLVCALLPRQEASAYSAEQAALAFSDGGVTASAGAVGCAVSGTALSITASGAYRVTGACREGSITVGKGLDVTLILDNLKLRSGATAPIVVKKDSRVLLILEGESTLTDDEDASTEETNADFEGAAIKVKTGSSLTVWGSGTLNAAGNAKNGLKGAAETALTVDGGTINVTASNNAVAFDGSVTVNAGTLTLTAGNDGVKAAPDETDTVSKGTVTINGGAITVRAQGDAIHAGSDLTVTGGSFDIQTMDGYQTRSFNANTMSAKGLKASGNVAEGEEAANRIVISGGDFRINTVDDAVHSDAAVDIIGGTFEIYTADDGVHAETTLTLGTEGGYARDPEITILSSYEGLEGCNINAYSGKYYIIASDDGMNAAGGSSNGSDPGGPWGPGGGGWRPGGPGGGGFPGGGGSSGSYSMNFYGGSYYVDCRGDGLDSNGALNLYGGDFSVLSMASGGDNSPLDADGAMLVKGATVFGAGSPGMRESPGSGSQSYYTDTTRRNAGTVVNVSCGGKVVFSETLVRNINYLFYSSPDMTSSSCSVATANAVTACRGNAWNHSWDDGVVRTAATADSPGVLVYTCADCGATERKTIPRLLEPASYEPEQTEPEEPAVYTAGFVTDGHAQIDLYYKQDYTAPDETDVQSAVARNSATGEVDGTGDGQINFAVRVEEGYELDSVRVEGSYKNLKDLSEGGEIKNLFRITKIESDLTVTVKTVPTACEHDYRAVVTAPACTEKGFTTYTCSKCGNSYVGDEVAALGHDYKAAVTAPTCTAKGYTAYTCSRCGDKYTGDEKDALGHDWGAGTVTKEPTETEKGERTYICSRCGQTRTEVIPELSHVHKYTAVVTAPTCTEAGFTTHTCTCGDSYTDTPVPALGHSYRGAVTAPTCTGKGYSTYTCTRCGDKYTGNETAALGHDYKAVVTAPTCTGKGYTTNTCARCGDKYTGNEIAALGHDYGEWTVTKAATCTGKGEETRACALCGEKETREIAAPGHDYKAVVTAPTCTEAGYTTHTCARCGDSYKDSDVPALGHDFKDGKCTRCGEADPDYVPPIDKAALQAAIAAAEQLDLSKYTDETADALSKALAAARAAFEAVTQADVDSAGAALEAAVISLIEKDKPFRFDDVQDENQYYFAPVYWAVDEGITTGTSPTAFSPNAGCTRAQVVTFLWRAAGKPEPTTAANPFADVKADAYYYKAVLWAVEKGITTGTSATTFRPDQTCTRGQIVTFLWRCNENPEPTKTENPFADVPAGQYYCKAVLWAVEKGITKGTGADRFSPDSTCTRAQIVTFLYRAK